MKLNKITQAILFGLGISNYSACLIAEETNSEILEANGQVVSNIADDFNENFASGDTESLIESLRTGDALAYEEQVDVNGDGVIDDTDVDVDGNLVFETVTVENTNGQMGNGEVSIALGLAEFLVGEEATKAEVINALYNPDGTGVLDLRESGMGWGQIALQFDTTMGEIMSHLKANEKASVAKAEHQRNNGVEKTQRIEKAEKPEKPEKPERPEKPEKPEKPERPEKPEKPERPGRD